MVEVQRAQERVVGGLIIRRAHVISRSKIWCPEVVLMKALRWLIELEGRPRGRVQLSEALRAAGEWGTLGHGLEYGFMIHWGGLRWQQLPYRSLFLAIVVPFPPALFCQSHIVSRAGACGLRNCQSCVSHTGLVWPRLVGRYGPRAGVQLAGRAKENRSVAQSWGSFGGAMVVRGGGG